MVMIHGFNLFLFGTGWHLRVFQPVGNPCCSVIFSFLTNTICYHSGGFFISCTNADDMSYTELAERVRYLKENKDGENTMMSRAVEEFGKRCEAKGLEKGLAEGRTEGRAEGRAEGRSVGRAEGADRMASLGDLLLKKGRTEDLKRSFSDPAYREQLFKEFGIA